jgi:hypothetical protein
MLHEDSLEGKSLQVQQLTIILHVNCGKSNCVKLLPKILKILTTTVLQQLWENPS